jgi:hypothetical protein
MALEVLGPTQPTSSGWYLEYMDRLGWSWVRKDSSGFRVDKRECVWFYTISGAPIGLSPDSLGCRDRS